jgi:spermidine synthase
VCNPRSVSLILKISLFATGCAGIVAEFVLSTMATYLLGNAIFQWTMVMSLMLFAMGVGSRISRFFRGRLLDTFITVEFCLSVLCALSAAVAYSISAYTNYTGLVIYAQATIIGCLIGLEIPLVTRLNEAYEELRINISGVLEKDYYGSLLGGLIFAFFALPYLGLTYTPILLGAVNFSVASLLLWRFFSLLERKKLLIASFIGILIFLTGLTILAKPIIRYGEQRKYRDKIVYAEQTRYQKIVMTQWKSYYWLYINGQEQFSTFDEYRYHEPLVHPAMKLSPDISHVLILGGGDGLALREVLKYNQVKTVTMADLDPAMTGLAKKHPILLEINDGSMNSPKVNTVNTDAAWFLEQDDHLYGVVIADLPDPDSIDLMHVYSENFYQMIQNHLIEGGILVTQATSSFFSHKAFLCILKTVRAAGFSAIAYHNQIPTMGQWGWVLGIKKKNFSENYLKQRFLELDFSDIPTRFLNNDAVISMAHFGKGIVDESIMAEIDINSELSPMLYRYYLQGSWGVY